MSDALYLVDGSGFIFRAFHALPPLTTRSGQPTGAAYGFAQMLLRLEQEHRPTHLAVVFDAGQRSFRHALYPAYKADRPPAPPELVPQFAMVRRLVDAFGVVHIEQPDYEADDIIATLTRRAQVAGLRVVIVSSDKDLMQLVSPDVVLCDTMKDALFGPSEVEAKFGVPPERLGDVLALMGDKVDSVPGVPGIGSKTAAAIITQLGPIEQVLAHIDELSGIRGAERFRALLREHAETARLSRRLVTLDEQVPLDPEIDLDALRRREPDLDQVAALLRELEFDRLLDRLRPAAAMASAAQPAATAAASSSQAAGVRSPAPSSAPVLVLADTPTRVVNTKEALSELGRALEQADTLAVSLELGEGLPRLAPLVGIALAMADHAPVYVPLGHRYLGAPQQLALAEVMAALGPHLARTTLRKQVHQVKDAYLVLGRLGVTLDGVVGAPELSGYLLDPDASPELARLSARFSMAIEDRASLCKTGRNVVPYETIEVARAAAYAGRQAAAALLCAPLLYAQVEAAGMGKLFNEIELPLAQVLAVVEAHGVRLDRGHLGGLGRELDAELTALEHTVWELAGERVNLGSPKQLQELLFGKLQLPPVKRTKTGLSTDAEVLAELGPLHPIAAKIHEHRVLAKLKSTYVDALPALVDPRTGRLHTRYNQTVAATGRLSSSEPNLQNIPIRTALGRKIRRAFIADPGNLLIAADYSQIELRIVAHLSQDPVLLDSFRRGEDVHRRTAAEVFHVAAEAVTEEMRNVAKAINFGLVYGQTDYGLSKVLGIHKAEAKRYIERYMERYAGVAAFMGRQIAEARRELLVRTLFGRIRPLPDLEARNRTVRGAAERMARNAPIQGTAADLLKLAMIQVQAELEAHAQDTRMLLTVHDELVLEAPAGDAERVGELVRRTMEQVWPLDVPLKVDVGIGQDWAAC